MKTIFFLFFTFFAVETLVAGVSQVGFISFDVSPKSNNKIILNNSGSTTITGYISISRGYGSYLPGQYDPVDFRYTVVYSNGTSETILKAESTITTSNFEPTSTITSIVFSFNIPSNYIGGQVKVKYRYYEWNSINSIYNRWVPNSGTYSYGGFTTSKSSVLPQDLVVYLQDRNLSTENVKDFGDYYLVEKDILIDKDDVAQDLETTNFGNVSNQREHNVNLYLEESVWTQSNWYSGIQAAVAQWNAVSNSDIKFHLLSSSYNTGEHADVVLKADGGQLSSDVPFASQFPANGNPGRAILVNTNYQGAVSTAQAVWIMIHAIGHCIGIKHLNALSFPGAAMNPANFSNSCGENCLSDFDKTAISELYLYNSFSQLLPLIVGSNALLTSSSTYRVSYNSSESNIIYKWEVIGINGTTFYYQDYESLPALELPFNGPGNYKVKCTISNGKFNTAIAEKDVTVSGW